MHETEPTDDEVVETGPTVSPVPPKPVEELRGPVGTLDLFDALAHIKEGKKVTKLEWGSKETYGFLDGGLVKLHKPDGQLYSWIISDGDLAGVDYYIVE